MASGLITVKSVSFFAAEQTVLSGVDVTIAEGERIVLVGPSGHGKTVLLKIMAGLIEPHEGEVWLDGVNLYQVDRQERSKMMKQVGMLFQKNALFDSLTAAENIAFPLRETTDKSEAEIKSIVEFFLEAVGLSHASQLFPDEISGGMQKRLGIARALALEPQIVFYDDPTAGLDPITSRKIIDLILEMQKKKGSTLVAITNEMQRAYQLASRIGMVVDGELIMVGGRAEALQHPDPRVQQFIHGALAGPLTEVKP